MAMVVSQLNQKPRVETQSTTRVHPPESPMA